jgi:hypothetical protein
MNPIELLDSKEAARAINYRYYRRSFRRGAIRPYSTEKKNLSSAILSLKRKRGSRLVEDKGLDFPCLIKDFPTSAGKKKARTQQYKYV